MTLPFNCARRSIPLSCRDVKVGLECAQEYGLLVVFMVGGRGAGLQRCQSWSATCFAFPAMKTLIVIDEL